MKFLMDFSEMVGRTCTSVKTSRTGDIPYTIGTITEYTLITFSDNTCILYRDDLDYDPVYGIVDSTDANINDKVRRELGL